MSVLGFLSGPRRKVAIGSAAALVAVGAWIALPSGAVPDNNTLTIAPASGSTINTTTGDITFTTPAAGCPSPANQATLRIKGTGITGEDKDPGFTNVLGVLEPVPAGAVTMTLGSDTWDSVAQNKSIPRPLNGTYTIKIQCLLDGEPKNPPGTGTALPFYDKDITFVGSGAAGSAGTWTVVAGATPVVTPVVTPVPGPDNTANDSVPAGGKAETNQAVTQADPVGTSVTSPVAGQVIITEGNNGGTPPMGYSFFGQQVSITAPAASAAAPLKLEFRLDASLINGTIPVVFRNGTLVPQCTNLAQPAATPDPCVEPFQNIGGGDVKLIVRTSSASVWNFGRPVNAGPIKDVAAACRPGGPVPAGWNVVEGTSGDDVLVGTAGGDVIRGLAGDDTLIGGGANDLICGGLGDDLISGNTGHDLLLGDVGDDAIYGGAGDDAIGGGSGHDNLNGGLGDDLISGGSGNDLIFGGRGDDLLYGDAGADQIYGEDGYDRLFGGPGSDKLVVGRRF